MNFIKQFAVKPDKKFNLDKVDPECAELKISKKEARDATAENIEVMRKLQFRMYAENKQSLLVIFQAMDAGGKDGVINSVLGPLNIQGCRVVSFKQPSTLELAHDFLWRAHLAVPRTGEVVVFNRSHYEDVLVTRVHGQVSAGECERRYEHINAFERLLSDRNTRVVKFMLHISKDEQLKRFADRLKEEDKHWKISESDYTEREHWKEYMKAFEDMLNNCSTECAPWFVIPANRKYIRDLAVSDILRRVLENMHTEFPEPTADMKKIKAMARAEAEKAGIKL